VNEVAHGFVPGQPIYFDSATGGWNLAQADSDTTTADALVFAVTDVDNFDYILAGELELTVGEWDVVVGATSAGLTTGEHYRLDESSLGMLTSTSPSGSISQFVLRALSTTKALVYVGEPHAAGIGSEPFEFFPVGGVIPFGGVVADIPSGWLACDGSEYGRTSVDANPQPELFQVVGTTWGVGNGSTSFNVPDMRARSISGINNANLPGGIDGGLTTREPGDTAGAETHTHNVPLEGNHGHGLTITADGIHDHTVNVAAGLGTKRFQQANPGFDLFNTDGSHNHAGSTVTAGGGHDHGGTTGSGSNLDPTVFALYIIRATSNSASGAFGVNLQNEGVPLGGPFGALNLPSSLVASDAGGGVATITQGPVGLPKRYIEGLLVEWGGTFTGADSKVIVRPGSCRSNDDLNDIALTTSTIADAAIKHTNLPGTGYAQLNGMDEKGLDDLAVGAITCSQAGNVVTTTASIIPHLTDHVLTGTMSTSGTALNGTVVAGPHLPGATRFEDELAVGDLVGNSTVGWSRVVAVNGYNSATLLTALAMGASSTATVIHQPTITPNDFIISGFTDKIDTIDSTGTSINVPTVAAVAPGSNLTIGRFVPDMWLAVWLIDDDGTNGPGLLLSTQHVNPISPPPGYTKFRRVGWVYIETQIPFPGYNIREMYYADGGVTRDVVYEIEDQPAQVAVQNPTTWTVVDFNAVAPRTARRLELRVVGDNSANGSIGLIYLRHLPGTSGPGTVARGRRLGIGANESHGHAVMMAPCNGIQQIQYAVDNVNLFASIMLIGFVDTL
jgi:microcystin-dependent protein